MIVVYRGKHCPVSKNYLASLQQIFFELDELGVEVVAVSGDGRERAEAFVSPSSMQMRMLDAGKISPLRLRAPMGPITSCKHAILMRAASRLA